MDDKITIKCAKETATTILCVSCKLWTEGIYLNKVLCCPKCRKTKEHVEMSGGKILEFPMKEIKARAAKLKRREKRLAKKEADNKAWAERYEAAMKKSKENIDDLTDDEFMALLGLGVDEGKSEV